MGECNCAPLVYSTIYAIFSGVALSAAMMRSPSFSLSSSSSTNTNSPLPMASTASWMLLNPGLLGTLALGACAADGVAAACVAVLGRAMTGAGRTSHNQATAPCLRSIAGAGKLCDSRAPVPHTRMF